MITVLLAFGLPLLYASGGVVSYRRQWVRAETAKLRAKAERLRTPYVCDCREIYGSSYHSTACDRRRWGWDDPKPATVRGGMLPLLAGLLTLAWGIVQTVHDQGAPITWQPIPIIAGGIVAWVGVVVMADDDVRRLPVAPFLAAAWPLRAAWSVASGLGRFSWSLGAGALAQSAVEALRAFVHPEIKIPDYDKINSLEKEPNHGP